MISPSPKIRQTRPARRHWIVFAPVVIFVALAGTFYGALFSGDPSNLPSNLIGKAVPQFSLQPLDGLKHKGIPVPGINSADFKSGKFSIVNIWASWCGPCRLEHPYLMQLAASGKVKMFGINYKDVAQNARRFLSVHGNPYHAVGVDKTARVSIDWGVYGVPETFVVNGEGRIILKHVGPLSAAIVKSKIEPLLAGKPAKP